jgi:hypothetical protein
MGSLTATERVDAAVDPNSDGFWMKLSQWNRYRHDTFKERREDELPFIPRECVLFIGTQFSILYTSMYSPAETATL